MAAGVAFDPAEFAAYKSSLSGPGAGAAREAAPVAPAADAFDPAEFQAFKASRSGGQRQPASFDERFSGAGTPDHPQRFSSEAASVTGDPLAPALRRTADEALIGKPSLENQIDAGLFRGANAIGLNLPRNAMAGIEALRSGKSFGQSYREVQDIEDALARQYPKTALGGTVGGVIGGAVALPAVRAAEGAGVGMRALANLKTGAAYAGASELFDSKDPYAAGKMAAIGGAAGAGGGYLIEKAAPVVSHLFAKNAPFRTADGALTDEASAALREAGLDPATITPQLAEHLETAFAADRPPRGGPRVKLVHGGPLRHE